MTIQLTHGELHDPTQQEISEAHSNVYEAVCYLKGTNIDYSEHEQDLLILESAL